MIGYHAFGYAGDYNGSESAINLCVVFPYLNFFMPWFFYKSGQFFQKRSCAENLNKDARKLLITFAIWSVIGYVLYLSFGALLHTMTLRKATYSIVRGFVLTGKIPINEPLWFLLTLFGVRFIANTILPDRSSKYMWLSILAISVIGSVVAYLAYYFNHSLMPYWVGNGTAGLVFFFMGYGLRDYESKWWLIAPCAIVYVICCIVGFPMVDMMDNELLTGNYLLWVPVALCGIVAFNAVCRLVTRYLRIQPIEIVGQYAMTILVTHVLVLSTILFVVTYWETTELYPYLVLLILAGYVVFLPLFCMVIPKIKILMNIHS